MTILFHSKSPIPSINWENMPFTEKIILNLIFLKKFQISFPFDLPNFQMTCILEKTLQNKPKKRPEEKLKFVFKRCFKTLLEIFKSKNLTQKKNLSSKNVLDSFIIFFYKNISQRSSIPLKEFYPPNRSKENLKTRTKTLNLKYLSKLAMNPVILSSMVEYICGRFRSDHEEESRAQMEVLIRKLRFMVWECLNSDLKNGLEQDRKKENFEIQDFKDSGFEKKFINLKFENFLIKNSQNQIERFESKKNSKNRKKIMENVFEELKTRILKKKLKIPWTAREVDSSLAFVSSKLTRIQKKTQLL